MKLIDNRYKIEKFIEDGDYFESYKIIDLWNEENIQYLKLYNSKTQNEIIEYYIDNFKRISNIKHKSLLSCSKFKLLKTIDTKNININQYYTISEYNNFPSLNTIIDDLNLKDRLEILLEIILVIDFIHFRGIEYKSLNPSNVFITNDKKIKIADLCTVMEQEVTNYYNEIDTYFISPKYIINKENNLENDYYAIGNMAKYLLAEDFLRDYLKDIEYKENFKLTQEQKNGMNNIINQLIVENREIDNLNLMEVVNQINKLFDLNYKYDIITPRNVLNFQGEIVGRQKDINEILKIDKNIVNKTIDYKGIIIKANEGIGKTRLINEMIYQLKIRGRNVYSVEVLNDKNKDFLYIAEILKQSIKDAPSNLMDKYRYELSRILPELRVNIVDNLEKLEEKSEIFRLYNRITNYFNELSRDKIIYIVIDNIHYLNNNVIMLLDYLIKNMKSDNIFFIFSFEEDNKSINPSVEAVMDDWIKANLFKENQLYKLNLQEIGEILRNILGMAYIPINFATALFKESEGNPKYIEYSINNLYSTNKLFISKKGNWYIDVKSYSEMPLPEDMHDALIQQLETIKGESYEMFKVMSIFNDIISKKTLFKVMGGDKKKLGKTLNKLIELKLVDERLADWGHGYSINNSELKRLIYDEISEGEKIKLHKNVANILETFTEENYTVVIEELLLHYIKSNQSKMALDFIFKMTEKIQNKHSYTILYLWEKAYEIVKDETSDLKLDILENILKIYFLKGIGGKMEGYLEEYQKESEELQNYKHIINGKFLLTEIYFKTAKLELGLKLGEEINQIAEENNIIEGKIIALIVKSRFKSRYGDAQDLETDLNTALELSEIHGITKHKGNIYNLLGLSYYMRGDTEKALENYEKSIYHHESNGCFIDAAKPINNIGNIYADKYADDEKAMEYYKKGLDIAYKYGFKEIEMVFLNNISEIYIRNYELGKAMNYMENVRKIAVELEDINIEFLANVNIGKIQLITGDYKNLYKTYEYLKELHERKGTIDIEIDTHYNNLLGNIYGMFGEWDKSIYHSQITANMCREFNFREYLSAKSRIVYVKFFKNKEFNKKEMEKIRNNYKKTEFLSNRRVVLLNFALISYISGDLKYSQELLDEDEELSIIYTDEFLKDLKEVIRITIEKGRPSIDKLIRLQSELNIGNFYNIRSITNIIIGFKLFNNEFYEESIKYFVDGLDDIYKEISKIPNFKMQSSYIASRKGDLIKENLVKAIKKTFNKDVQYLKLRNLKEEDLYNYFDTTSIFKLLSNEEISKITKLDYYGDAMDLNGIEDLLLNLTGDYQYNLDLIIKYISKNALAKMGMILSYDVGLGNFTPISTMGTNLDYKINRNILNLATKYKRGILINNTIEEMRSKRYESFLTDDVKGIICVPIFISEDTKTIKIERRSDYVKEQKVEALVYLETDKSFNRFDKKLLQLITDLSYLIYTNLENNKLRTIATTDKLTGLYTRKHYEFMFEQFLNDMRINNGTMSVIMLDIDNFKNVNDTYGHSKGDEVLKLIGGVIKSSVRTSDIVGRYGGEEFVVLLKNTTREKSILIGEKIRSSIEKLKVPGISHPITISLGISLYPNHGLHKEELIEKADQALYCAKETGKNKVSLWNSRMTGTLNRADKLAGILTGNMNEDNRKVLDMMNVIELIKKDNSLDDKIFTFLGILLNTIDGELATLILRAESKEGKVVFNRSRFNENWVSTPKLNYNIINKVSNKFKGEFLIDWDDTSSTDPISGLPNWKSIMVLPLIKNGNLKGILYISVPIKVKEFNFDCFNISKTFADIFAALL